MECVYGFTNENVASYQRLYNLDQKDILSVLGSGDQYFTAVLNGAENVDLFDINEYAWLYFVLKRAVIANFNYDKFYRFLVIDKLNNPNLYQEIRKSLPPYVQTFFDNLVARKIKLSSILIDTKVFDVQNNAKDDKIIPYFDPKKYYKLQTILQNKKMPKFYHGNLTTLYNKIKKEKKSDQVHYDLMFLSNIYHYLNMDLSEFKDMLTQFDCPTFQAMYYWFLNKDELQEYQNLGFFIDAVHTAANMTNRTHDYVLTLNKKNR